MPVLPATGKTGTVAEAGGGNRDVWTVAYTPQLAVSVWMGYDSPDEAHHLSADQGGSGYPARLCAAFLGAISSELSGGDFSRPSGVRTALLDALALENDRQALLSTEKTPAKYTMQELFHAGSLPTAFSENWTAPKAVPDFRLLTGPGEMPVLSFTCQEGTAEYAVLRTVNGESVELASLTGEPGSELRFADDTLDLSQAAEYTLMPRNALLHAGGEMLYGPVAGPVKYVPGGILNQIMGVGVFFNDPAPTEIEYDPDQSLFT